MAGPDDDYAPDGDAAGIAPRPCRVDECLSQLDGEKLFYKRARCCSRHARQLQVVVEGQERRFCQQCCGFHKVSAFDGTRRSCRVRLEAHNERQRKRWSDSGGSRRRPRTDATDDLFEDCAPRQPAAQSPQRPQPPQAAPRSAAAAPADLAQAAVAALFAAPKPALPAPIYTVIPGQDGAATLQSLMGGQCRDPAPAPWPANPFAACSAPLPRGSAGDEAPPAAEGQQRAAGAPRMLRSNSAELGVRTPGLPGNDGASQWGGVPDPSRQQAAAAAAFAAHRSYSLGSTLPPAAGGAGLIRGDDSEVDRLLGRSEGALEATEWGQSASSLATAGRSTSIESAGTSAINVGGAGAGLRLRSWSATALELDSWKAAGDVEMAELVLDTATEALAFAEQAPEPLVRAQQLMGLHLPAHRRPRFSYRACAVAKERRSLDTSFARASDPYAMATHQLAAELYPGEQQHRRGSLDAHISKMNKHRVLGGGTAKRVAREDLPRKQLSAAFMWLGDGWDTDAMTPPT